MGSLPKACTASQWSRAPGASRRISGAASSTYWLGFDGGMAIGMLFFGVIIDWGSYPAAFLFSAGYMLLFGIIAFFILRKVKPLRELENPEE